MTTNLERKCKEIELSQGAFVVIKQRASDGRMYQTIVGPLGNCTIGDTDDKDRYSVNIKLQISREESCEIDLELGENEEYPFLHDLQVMMLKQNQGAEYAFQSERFTLDLLNDGSTTEGQPDEETVSKWIMQKYKEGKLAIKRLNEFNKS